MDLMTWSLQSNILKIFFVYSRTLDFTMVNCIEEHRETHKLVIE